jgi:hypothetical protein
MPLILEGLVTTIGHGGQINIAPMGPIVDREVTHLTLRPFRTSTTFANLKDSGVGVFHVTDNVEMLARAAIDAWTEFPRCTPASSVAGMILADACRWFAFQVREFDDSEERSRIECDVVDHGRHRDFFGFNRAKHAVLEAAVLATRVGILPAQQILDEFQRLAVTVRKTAGDQEQRAWELLESHVRERLAQT